MTQADRSEATSGNVSHAGRIVMISGASSGLGEQFALLLAERGARIVAAARRADKLSALVDTIRARGGEAIAVPLDVTDEASVIAAYDAAEAAFGPVDTVIANAGINALGSSLSLSMADYDAIQAVNQRGVFLTVREAGRRLRQSGDPSRGRVLIVASMGGIHALSGLVAYCATKAAAVMLARGFAKEWVGLGICVNALCPGYMLTEINEDWFTSETGRAMIDQQPRGRLMPVEALLPTVAHLTSDEAAYVTGSVVQIDDGQMI